MLRSNRLFPFLALMLGLGVMVPAQSADQGQINAMVFKEIAQGSAIMVRPMDNSDQNLMLQEKFEAALAQQGYRISADAPLILSFETRDVVGAWSDSGRRSIVELEGRGGRMGGEEAKARVNLFNSSRGGLFNQGQGETNIVTQGHYRMDVSIDSNTDGKRAWQAWAESDLGQYHGDELLAAMVPFIVKSIGKTIRQEPFNLP